MEAVKTRYNLSDAFTKALGRIKFYEQKDVIMGRRIPPYSFIRDRYIRLI